MSRLKHLRQSQRQDVDDVERLLLRAEHLASAELFAGLLLPFLVVGFVREAGHPAVLASAALGADSGVRLVLGGRAAAWAESLNRLRRLHIASLMAAGRSILAIVLAVAVLTLGVDGVLVLAVALSIVLVSSVVALVEDQSKFFMRGLFSESPIASHTRFQAVRQLCGRGALVVSPVAIAWANSRLLSAGLVAVVATCALLGVLSARTAGRYILLREQPNHHENRPDVPAEQTSSTQGETVMVFARWYLVFSFFVNLCLGGVALALGLSSPSALAWFYGGSAVALVVMALYGRHLDIRFGMTNSHVAFIVLCSCLAASQAPVGSGVEGVLLAVGGIAYGVALTGLTTWAIRSLRGSHEARLSMRAERAGRLAALASIFVFGALIDASVSPSAMVAGGSVLLLLLLGPVGLLLRGLRHV